MSRKWIRKKYEHEIILSKHGSPGVFDYILVLDHLKPDFNIGKIYRSASAMGCREVWLVGIDFFDPRPAMGTVSQSKTRLFENFAQAYEELKKLGATTYALEPRGEAVLGLEKFEGLTAFVLGHEEYGFSFEPRDFSDLKLLKIAQFGKVESLNVSIAASLACFEFVRQRSFKRPD